MNLDAGTINVPMKDIVGSISAKVRVTGMPAFGCLVNVELEGPK